MTRDVEESQREQAIVARMELLENYPNPPRDKEITWAARQVGEIRIKETLQAFYGNNMESKNDDSVQKDQE